MILDGKSIADQIQKEIHERIKKLPRPPSLAVILVGHNAASETYVGVKGRACEAVGIQFKLLSMEEGVKEKELLHHIHLLNKDPAIDGILVQFPLPSSINSKTIVQAIDPAKDVDGFHPLNMGKLLLEQEDGFVPCTPLGIRELLKRTHIPIESKHALIIGRSIVVGKPLAALLVQNNPMGNATVTLAHSRTHNLPSLCRQADILIAAIGQPHFITEAMVKEGAVVIDVGINRMADSQSPKGYRIVGDVDFEKVAPRAFAITPVPKGVGPVTVAMLLHNTTLSAERRLGSI